MSSSCEPSARVWTAACEPEVLPPSVDAAVSESAMVEACSMSMPRFDDGDEWIAVVWVIEVVEKASAAGGEPMARSTKAAAATSA